MLGVALPPDATVVIDLTEPYRGPLDYRSAVQPEATAGGAVVETRRGNSPQREAQIVWQPPAGGLPGGVTVTITLPSGIVTGPPTTDLLAVATRGDTGASAATPFAVL